MVSSFPCDNCKSIKEDLNKIAKKMKDGWLTKNGLKRAREVRFY